MIYLVRVLGDSTMAGNPWPGIFTPLGYFLGLGYSLDEFLGFTALTRLGIWNLATEKSRWSSNTGGRQMAAVESLD